MTDPKDLLAVLDLPEDERPKRFYELGYLREYIKLSKMSGGVRSCVIRADSAEDAEFFTCLIALADLALKLTPQDSDEWTNAKILVWEYHNPEETKFEEYTFKKKAKADSWFMSSEATATDRIVAALIAKMAKEQK